MAVAVCIAAMATCVFLAGWCLSLAKAVRADAKLAREAAADAGMAQVRATAAADSRARCERAVVAAREAAVGPTADVRRLEARLRDADDRLLALTEWRNQVAAAFWQLSGDLPTPTPVGEPVAVADDDGDPD